MNDDRNFLISLLWAVFFVACVSGCANPTPVSNNPNPVADPANALQSVVDPQGVLKQDLTDAAYNLDQATAIGVIPSSLPVAACQHKINQFLGVEVPAGGTPYQQFTPKIDGAVSFGSVAFIDALKAYSAANGGITVPQECYTVIGYFTVFNASKVLQVVAPTIPGVAASLGLPVPLPTIMP